MRAQQKNLFEYFDMKDTKRRYGRTQHGGANTKGRRKNERPLSTKHWIHLVLKSDKATGKLSFLHKNNQPFVEATLEQKAEAIRRADRGTGERRQSRPPQNQDCVPRRLPEVPESRDD